MFLTKVKVPQVFLSLLGFAILFLGNSDSHAMGGSSGDVGDVMISAFYKDSNDTSAPYDVILQFTRTNGSDHIHSWKLTVSDGSNTQYYCDKEDISHTEFGNTNYATITDQDDGGNWVFDESYSGSRHSGESNVTNFSDLMTLAPGDYTITVAIYSEDKCKTNGSTDSFSVTLPIVGPPSVSGVGGTLDVSEGNSAAVIDSSITIDDGYGDIVSATITLSSGYQSSQDVLAFTNANGITGSWNSGTGVMTLSGSASKANYETALESITYQNTNTDDPNNTNRTISWVVNNGSYNSPAATSTITVADVNDAPTIIGDLAITVAQGASVYILGGDLNYSDADDEAADGGVKYYIDTNVSHGTLETYNSGSWAAFTTDTTGGRWADKTTNEGLGSGTSYMRYTHDGSTNSTDLFKIKVQDDGGAASSVAQVNISISIANQAPVLATAGGTLAYAEGDSATTIDATLAVSDSDDTNIESATITISSGYQSSEDVLAFSNANGITGSWNSGTGVLTLSGSDSKANYETALESITYQNTNTDDPNNSNRTITWLINDGDTNSAAVTSTITVADVNDAPVLANAGGTLAYTEGDAATVVDNSLSITDVDDSNQESATITISSGYQSSEDVLAFTNANDISGSWDSGSGVLTLSGSASKANYETALESITYQNTNTDDPNNTNRVVSWVINDGGASSSAVTSTITIGDANDAPVLSDASATLAYTEGDSATVIDASLTIADVDDTNIASATITISSGYQSSEDILAFTNTDDITGSWDSGTGVLSLSGSASKANYETALESITYQNTNTADPNNTNRVVSWVINDGTANSVAATSTITVAKVNDAPVLADAGATLAYTEGDSASVIDSSLTITDVDDSNIESATITVSSGYQSSEDVLAFSNANGITGSWNSSSGVLTLSGSATKANYETALESITYFNNETDDPNNTNRTITWVVSDGDNNSTGITSTITIADSNDAPTVSDAGSTLAYTEDDAATVIDSSLTITDADDTNIEGATITISGGYQSSEDVLDLGNTSLGISVESNTSGVLTLTGSATIANYETALESVTYQNTNTSDPNNDNRTVTWVVNDGAANSSGVTSTITVADLNDAPVISDAGATLMFEANDDATVIDSALTVTDADDDNLASASISISSGFQSSEDVLAFTNANGITGSWNGSNGTLSLSGSASKANYKLALQSITYQNTNASTPNTANRTITWIINDGTTNSNSTTSTVSVAAPSLHHYAVSYDLDGSSNNDANGANCVATPVTITAHNAGHSAVTTSNTVTLTTSSGNGAWVSNADNASISIGFGGANAITTYLRHPSTGATTINVTDGSNSESEDPTYTFNAASMPLFCEKTEILS